MKTLSGRIEKILKDLPDLGQIGLANAAKASKSVVNQWVSGEIKSMRLDYALNIERELGYNHIWLVLGQGEVTQISRNWPFSVNQDLYYAMDNEERQRLNDYVEYTVSKWHGAQIIKSKKAG